MICMYNVSDGFVRNEQAAFAVWFSIRCCVYAMFENNTVLTKRKRLIAAELLTKRSGIVDVQANEIAVIRICSARHRDRRKSRVVGQRTSGTRTERSILVFVRLEVSKRPRDRCRLVENAGNAEGSHTSAPKQLIRRSNDVRRRKRNRNSAGHAVVRFGDGRHVKRATRTLGAVAGRVRRTESPPRTRRITYATGRSDRNAGASSRG